MTIPSPQHESIREELERVLSTPVFRRAERSSTLLRFVVEEAIEGRAERLKEYTLGAEALGRGQDFDPRTDPTVRAEASRLRKRLEEYYETLGQSNPLVIMLPKGSYVPQFVKRQSEVEQEEPNGKLVLAVKRRIVRFTVAAALLAIAFAAGFYYASRGHPSNEQLPVEQFDVALTS